MGSYSICSKPDCKFTKKYGKNESCRDYCALCGAQMIHRCPHCSYPINERKAAYCVNCGKQLKDQPHET